MSLARVPLSQPVRVFAVQGSDMAAYRLMEMGFVKGAEVEVIGRAPLGDPLRIRLGDCTLSLRTSEAARVEVRDCA